MGGSYPGGKCPDSQKMELLKRSDLFRNLIVAFSVFLFILQVKSDPCKRIFKNFILE